MSSEYAYGFAALFVFIVGYLLRVLREVGREKAVIQDRLLDAVEDADYWKAGLREIAEAGPLATASTCRTLARRWMEQGPPP